MDCDDLNPCDEMYGSPHKESTRFPTWDSVLPQSILAPGLLSVVDSSFLALWGAKANFGPLDLQS